MKWLPQAKNLPEGYCGFFPVDAMRIDINGYGWIDPLAEPADQNRAFFPQSQNPVPSPTEISRTILLERVPGGFNVNLKYMGGTHQWDHQPNPNMAIADRLPWFEVIEFVS
jgi:hypothetical protein